MAGHQDIMTSLDSIEESIDKMVIKQRVMDDELLQLKQRGAVQMDESPVSGKSLGSKIWREIEKNGDLMTKTGRIRLEVKAAGDALTTTTARTISSQGVGVPSGALLGAHNAFPQRVVGPTSASEYSRYLALEGAAAVQAAEGDAKAAVRPTFSLITQPAITLAGYTKISKQALSDSTELQNAIDVTLRRSLNSALDSFLCVGAWGGAAGLLAHATTSTSLVYTGLVDALSEGVATMQTAGFMPDTVAISPADWLGICVAKASGSGEYLSGSYLGQLGENLRGLRVVLSPGVTAGKGLLIDSSQVELLIVEDLAIEIGTDADDFTRNVRTVLGEMRVMPVFRAVGGARLITPAP